MKHGLREFSADAFSSRLREAVSVPLSDSQTESLHAHYRELSRWVTRTSLIGPGTFRDALWRHYAESLAGIPLLPAKARNLVDVGSGAGFPGFVLAVMRPDLRTFLVESRQKKRAFLQAAARRVGVRVVCVDERLGASLPRALPAEIDVLTLRAVRLPIRAWRAIAERLARSGRVLVWMGSGEPLLTKDATSQSLEQSLLDVGLRTVDLIDLDGSDRRRVVSFARA